MSPFIQRGTALTLSFLLLLFAGFGDALHWLPGMGHEGHCHGWSCGSSSGHAHRHEHGQHATKASCCGSHSKAVSLPESAGVESNGVQVQEQHECGLCKFLASLKHATSLTVACHEWSFLPAPYVSLCAQQAKAQVAFLYRGRAPPIVLG